MTGAQFKSLAKRLHGHKWASKMAEFMKCHRTTVWHWSKMAQVPDEIVRKLSKAKP